MSPLYKQVIIVEKLNASTASLEQLAKIDDAVQLVTRAAEIAGAKVIGPEKLSSADHWPDLLIVAIGGDGTMLEAMRGSARIGCTAIGINLGNVGFLTDISLKQLITDDFARIIYGTAGCTVEERSMVALNGSTWNDIAGNEVSISRMESDSMITYRLWVGKHDAGVHKANSVLISTPTGSTAYSLSAGGALMMPDVDALQIVPVAPMAMTTRPIIAPLVPIMVQAWGKGIAVRTDGTLTTQSQDTWTEANPYITMVTPFARKAKILHPQGWNYFNILSDKLGWIKK